MPLLPYRPHPLLRSGHLQTLLVGLVCGWRPSYSAQQRIVPLSDGDALVVHEEQRIVTAANAPLTILIHGLGGDHSSPYLQRIAHNLHIAGHRVWRVDLRGSGAGLPHAWRPPHAGCSQDLAAVVAAATTAYPTAAIHLVGFSLSGNIVLKLLGEAWAKQLKPAIEVHRIASALAIAPPIDLPAGATNMDRFSRRLYTHYYLKVLAAQVATRSEYWPQWHQIQHAPRVQSIRQFDSRYTAPLSGFDSAEHYYDQASALPWLPLIQTPTKILVDHHDPIVTRKAFSNANLNATTTEIVRTRHGGHMGYFGLDADGNSMRWMEHFVQYELLHNSSAN